MINTDGTPTIANARGIGSTRRTVIVTAHVRIEKTLLAPEEWREIVETALRDNILTVGNDSIDATITHVSTDR